MNTNKTSEELQALRQLIFEHTPEDKDVRLRMIVQAIKGGGQLPANDYVQIINEVLDTAIAKARKVIGETSDGYHTFNELYEYRMAYNAALFNEWAAQRKYNVYKSERHSDGELCFGGGWFVVGAQLPTGQITNHYEMKHWDKFIVPVVPRGAVWDGHTPQQALERLESLTTKETEADDTI